MRILTGSVLALLVGGVAYMNLTTPPAERDDDASTQSGASEGAPVGSGPVVTADGAPPTGGPEGQASAGGAAIVPVRVGNGDAQAAIERIALDGPGLDRSAPSRGGAVPDLKPFDAARDTAAARNGAAPGAGEAVVNDLLGTGPRGAGAAPGATTNPPNVGTGPGTLRGRVVAASGAVLSGVTLEVVAQGDTEVVGGATTDDVGAYAVPGLEPGLYQVRVVAGSLPEGYAATWYPDLCRGAAMPAGIGSPCFAVLADGSAAPQELVLVRAGRVEGRVIGRDGAPASDALARVVADGPGLDGCRAVTNTDATGLYSFDLVPGKYRLEVAFRPDGPNGSVAPFEPRTIVVDEAATTALPTLRAPLALASGAPVGRQDAPPRAGAQPNTGTDPSADPTASVGRRSVVALDLYGRVLSNFGEPLVGLEVVVFDGASTEARGVALTDANGEWSIPGATGSDLHVVARGERLLAPSEPVSVRAEEGQRRIRVTDLLVEVRRVFHLEGEVIVSDSELADFASEIAVRVGRGAELDDAQVRRAYLRGLRLEQRNVGARRGRRVAIGEDGKFAWSCALPADDVEFLLEARGLRTGGRASRTRLLVTPAGDRTVSVRLPFPSSEAISVQPTPVAPDAAQPEAPLSSPDLAPPVAVEGPEGG